MDVNDPILYHPDDGTEKAGTERTGAEVIAAMTGMDADHLAQLRDSFIGQLEHDVENDLNTKQ